MTPLAAQAQTWAAMAAVLAAFVAVPMIFAFVLMHITLEHERRHAGKGKKRKKKRIPVNHLDRPRDYTRPVYVEPFIESVNHPGMTGDRGQGPQPT